ncbi:MAG: hypothetical protein R2939_07620 [Kofleriaceae bacterium]
MRLATITSLLALTVSCGDAPTTCDDACAGPVDAAAPPPDAVPLADGVDHALLWQGFDHEWLREVVGFRVPHRVSLLDSYLDEITATDAGGWRVDGTYHAGQSTGVDGNYMRPRVAFAAVTAPGLWAHAGDTHLTWTDRLVDVDVDGAPYPRASSTFDQEVVLGVPPGGRYALALRGVALDMACRDEAQPPETPCNSNGMWPYRMAIDVRDCDPGDGADGVLRCRVHVEIARAWTPNHGGLPGVEEKPLNAALDYDLRVLWTALGGAVADVGLARAPIFERTQAGHEDAPVTTTTTITGAPGFTGAVAALDHVAFTLAPPDSSNPEMNHLGRYLGQLAFNTTLTSHDAATGAVELTPSARVWLPDTVVDAEISHEVGTLVLWHRGQSAQGDATTSLCVNSSDQAPDFSAWEECDQLETGPERTRSVTSVSLP